MTKNRYHFLLIRVLRVEQEADAVIEADNEEDARAAAGEYEGARWETVSEDVMNSEEHLQRTEEVVERQTKRELQSLRLSLARLADEIGGVYSPLLENPIDNSRGVDHGWNNLALRCIDQVRLLRDRIRELESDG